MLETSVGSPPGGRKSRHSFLTCAWAALRCPHLRQTHVVLIHCIRTDSFTLSASRPPKNLSRVSSSIPSVRLLSPYLCLWQQPSFLSPCVFPFCISHVPCQHLFYIVSPSFVFFFLPFPPTLCLLNTPALALLVIHSTRNVWTIFLQEHHNCVTAGCITSLSHPTALRDSCQKHLSPPEMRDCVCGWSCFLNHKESEKHTVCFYNCSGT